MNYIIKNSLWSFLLVVGFCSCEKGDYVKSYAEFVNVYFDGTKVALANNGEGIFIAAKYNGYPIAWDVHSKKIKVVEGEGKFEFYDTRDGRVVAEKTVDVKPGTQETYMLFQPTEQSAVSFVDPHAQDNEAAAPAGHIKLKVGNYAQEIIPFEKIDIKVSIQYFDADWNEFIEEVGTIKGIGNSVDDAAYHILPDGVPDGVTEYGYTFEISDNATGQPLLNHGGTNYSMAAFMPPYMDPVPVKQVYTLFLVARKAWGEAPPFIKLGDDFYEVAANVLFAN